MSLRGNQLFGHKGTNKQAKIQKLVFVFLLRARVPSRRSRKVRISEQNIKNNFHILPQWEYRSIFLLLTLPKLIVVSTIG